MNAALPERLLLPADPQEPLPLATEGVYRVVWQSRFGPILIEVEEGVVYVNGDRVEQAPAAAAPGAAR